MNEGEVLGEALAQAEPPARVESGPVARGNEDPFPVIRALLVASELPTFVHVDLSQQQRPGSAMEHRR